MNKVKLKKLMNQYCILPCELDDVFAFVADLLYLQRQDLEKNEPYATRTIDELRKAESVVDDLIDYVEDLEEE